MNKELHKDICNKQLFAKLYERYSDDIHNYLYYKYGERLDPRDKTQEAFIKLWQNCKKIVPSNAKAFLYKVANNLMLNEVKHQKVVLKFQKIKPKEYTHEDPEFLMEHNEFMLKYQKALASLSEEQRVAFTLNKIEGKKHAEVAELLGVTQKVVEYRIYSAFKILKEQLKGISLK